MVYQDTFLLQLNRFHLTIIYLKLLLFRPDPPQSLTFLLNFAYNYFLSSGIINPILSVTSNIKIMLSGKLEFGIQPKNRLKLLQQNNKQIHCGI